MNWLSSFLGMAPLRQTAKILYYARRGVALLKTSSQCHPTYASLHYVLLFQRGQLGWHWEIPLKNAQHTTTSSHKSHKSTKKGSRAMTSHDPDESIKTVSQINYYAYCLFSRHEEYSCILHGGKLLQEYILDSWASSE